AQSATTDRESHLNRERGAAVIRRTESLDGLSMNRTGCFGKANLIEFRAKALNAGDFVDELLQDRLGKRIVIRRGHHQRAGAADHIVEVIFVEVRLERKDRQAVDGDAAAYRLVASERD